MSVRRGLTLLELLVALVVTGAATAGGYATFAALVDHHRRAAASSAMVMRAAITRATLISWLEGARLDVEQAGPVFHGNNSFDHDSIPDDALTWLTAAHTAWTAGESFIHLAVIRPDSTRDSSRMKPHGLVATLDPWPPPGLTPGLASRTVVLDTAVNGLRIRYLSGVYGGRQWLPSWISTSVLPLAVAVQLLPAPGDSLPPLLRLPIIVPLRAGQ